MNKTPPAPRERQPGSHHLASPDHQFASLDDLNRLAAAEGIASPTEIKTANPVVVVTVASRAAA